MTRPMARQEQHRHAAPFGFDNRITRPAERGVDLVAFSTAALDAQCRVDSASSAGRGAAGIVKACRGLTGTDVVSVSPDAGRAKMAVRFAEMLEADFALMHKTRPAHDTVAVTEITGRVRGKTAVLGDDVIMTGGTLLANMQALKEHGVEDVWVFATHGLFCGNALERFADADIAQIIVTDTVPIDPLRRPPNMTVLPVSGLLAETITNVFSDDSVSAIFGGDTQLF